MTAPALYRRELPGGGDLTVISTGQGLVISLQQMPLAIGGGLTRDDVRDLVQALDDWLYDSRPR